MKRLIPLLLLLICFVQTSDARMNAYIAGSVVASVGKTCVADKTTLLDNSTANDSYVLVLGSSADYTYSGQGWYTAGAVTICDVSYYINGIVGDTSAIDTQVEIHTMSTNTLNAVVCTSATQKISTTGLKTFTFTNCTLSGSTVYSFPLTRTDHSYSDTNYMSIRQSTTSTVDGYLGVWKADKTYFSKGTTEDYAVKIEGFTP